MTKTQTLAAAGIAVLALAASAAHAESPRRTPDLPYGGIIDSIDVATSQVTFTGPDGQKMTLKVGTHLLRESKAPVELKAIEEPAGKLFATFLKDETTARAPYIIEPVGKPLKMYIGAVLVEDRMVAFSTGDGFVERYKPMVNLGASVVAGEAPVRASWEWFKEHKGQPCKLRLATMGGVQVIWSVEPWDPKKEPVETL